MRCYNPISWKFGKTDISQNVCDDFHKEFGTINIHCIACIWYGKSGERRLFSLLRRLSSALSYLVEEPERCYTFLERVMDTRIDCCMRPVLATG